MFLLKVHLKIQPQKKSVGQTNPFESSLSFELSLFIRIVLTRSSPFELLAPVRTHSTDLQPLLSLSDRRHFSRHYSHRSNSKSQPSPYTEWWAFQNIVSQPTRVKPLVTMSASRHPLHAHRKFGENRLTSSITLHSVVHGRTMTSPQKYPNHH